VIAASVVARPDDQGVIAPRVTAAQALLRQVNDTTGESWQLDAPLARGKREGAWRVRRGDHVAVFKWFAPEDDSYNPDAPVIVEVLRRSGYPTPAWLASGRAPGGIAWCVQELVEGDDVHDLERWSAELLVELVERQRALTPPTRKSWNAYVRALVSAGHPSHRALRAHGGAVERLLHAALVLAAPHASAPLTDTEMVHGDLSVSNLLVRDGRLVAVVDIAAAGRGCAAYDLLSLVVNGVYWRSDPRAVQRLVDYGNDAFDPASMALATACVLIETASWYRVADPGGVDRRARRLLDWLTSS
jgi:hypothetical protein